MNALELLKSDHDRVNDLFDQVQQVDQVKDKRRIFQEIRQELEMHAHIEETVFYPAFADRPEFKDLIEQSYEDHLEVKELIQEISGLRDENEFEDCVDDLIDCVQDHVEEEEDELFPRIRTALSEDELNELGTRLQSSKQSVPKAA